MKNIFPKPWFFVSLFCCIVYWGQSQGLVTSHWANIGAQNANGDFAFITIDEMKKLKAI